MFKVKIYSGVLKWFWCIGIGKIVWQKVNCWYLFEYKLSICIRCLDGCIVVVVNDIKWVMLLLNG